MFCVEKYNPKKRRWDIVPDTLREKKKIAEDLEKALNSLVTKEQLRDVSVTKIYRTTRLRSQEVQALIQLKLIKNNI